MAGVKGHEVVKAVYQEDAWGEVPTTPAGFLAYCESIGLAMSQEMIDDPTMLAGRGKSAQVYGNIDVSGSISVVMAPTHIGFWLKQCIGDPTTTGTAAPYTHVFTPDTLPSFIFEQDFNAAIADKVIQYTGCKVASWTIDLPQSGPCKLSMQVSGKGYLIDEAPLDGTLTDLGHLPFSGFNGKIYVDSTQIGSVKMARISCDNEMDTSVYTFPGGGETAGLRGDLPEGRAAITGELEMIFDSFDYIDLAIAQTEVEVEITLIHGAGDGTAGDEILTLTLDHVRIPLHAPAIETRSGLSVTVPLDSYTVSTDLGITATLKNAIASY